MEKVWHNRLAMRIDEEMRRSGSLLGCAPSVIHPWEEGLFKSGALLGLERCVRVEG
jgi:hypothetical protein